MTRNRGERNCPTCIQHQLHRSRTTPIYAQGAIGYSYKSNLVFFRGSGKTGAFTQKDYLAQVLKPHICPVLEAFAAATHLLRPSVEPLAMEDRNSAHGHKSTTNYCQQFRTQDGIILMPRPSTSPDMNQMRSAGGGLCGRCTDENTSQ